MGIWLWHRTWENCTDLARGSEKMSNQPPPCRCKEAPQRREKIIIVAADFNFLSLPPFSLLHSVRGMGNDAFSFLSSPPSHGKRVEWASLLSLPPFLLSMRPRHFLPPLSLALGKGNRQNGKKNGNRKKNFLKKNIASLHFLL